MSASADTTPTIALAKFPSSVITNSSYWLFNLTVTNPGAALPNTRIDVHVTGSSAMPGTDVRLQFRSGIWVGPTLAGTAGGPGGMSGYLGQPSGSTLASGTTSFSMRIGFVASTPADTLSASFHLDVLDPSTDTPAATLDTTTGSVKVVPETTPATPDVSVVATSGLSRTITLKPQDADGYAYNVTNTDPSTGTVTHPGSSGTVLTYTAPADFIGTDTFTYTADGPYSEVQNEEPPSSTGTVTVTVKAPTTLKITTTPTRPTIGHRTTLTVRVTSAGDVDGGDVTMTGTATTLTNTVSNGSSTFTLPALLAGSHHISVNYAGTATSQTASSSITDTVSKATTHLSAAVRPTHLTTATRHPQIVTTVTSQTGSTKAGRVSIYAQHKFLGQAVVRSNKTTITVPRQSAGNHTWTIRFSGTPTTQNASTTAHVNVKRA